jgi:hypothetical protein
MKLAAVESVQSYDWTFAESLAGVSTVPELAIATSPLRKIAEILKYPPYLINTWAIEFVGRHV